MLVTQLEYAVGQAVREARLEEEVHEEVPVGHEVPAVPEVQVVREAGITALHPGTRPLLHMLRLGLHPRPPPPPPVPEDSTHKGHRSARPPPKHLYNICTTSAQRRRRCADVVQMLCKCFVFAGSLPPPDLPGKHNAFV